MAKSGQTFNKREKEKQRAQQRQEKQEKMAERKANGGKPKSLEDMMVYLDENGNFTNKPPDPSKRKEIAAEDIVLGVHHPADEEQGPRTGIIDFFNTTKGFGFIKESGTGNSYFFHQTDLTEAVKEGNSVQFEIKDSPKGPAAFDVKRV